MTTKKINELREETYNSINEFRNADIITDKQYEILRKQYNKVKDSNRKNIYNTIINKLNSFIAENVMDEKSEKELFNLPINEQQTKLSRDERLNKTLDKIHSKKNSEKNIINEPSKHLTKEVKLLLKGTFLNIVIQGDDLTNNDKDNITVDTNELKTIMQREILEVFFNDNKDNKVNLFVNAIIYFQMTKIDKFIIQK